MAYKSKESWRKWRSTAAGIWNALESNYKKGRRMGLEVTRKQFIEWYNQQEKKCHYCGIVEADLPKMKIVKSIRLSIDRKDNDQPYKVSNIVLACYRCNMVKGYTFTEKEMIKIAKIYLIGRY